MTIQSSRVTSKGQITIPAGFRDALEIYPGQMVKIVLCRDSISVTPYDPVASLKGSLKSYAEGRPYNRRKMQKTMEREIAKNYVRPRSK